jgi:hypothetical protein
MRCLIQPLVLGFLWMAQQEPFGYTGVPKLLLNEAVQQELKLSDAQLQQAGQMLRDVGGKYKPLIADLQTLSAAERFSKYNQLVDQVNGEMFTGLKDVLDAKQMERLRQLDRREQGPRIFRDSDILQQLKLTDEQQNELKTRSRAGIKQIGEINVVNREEAARKIAAVQQKTLDEIVGLFTDEQKKTWAKLLGDPIRKKPPDMNNLAEYSRFLRDLTEQGKYDPKKFQEFEEKVLKANGEGRWKEIHWQENMAVALKQAKADQKPIFLYMVVGHKGEQKAAEC